MIDFSRNNLDMGGSPYLQQHRDNPINWQEWREEVLHYAKISRKYIFLSIGYSTCHWCHAMAGDAFQDEETAGYLNKHFVSIKVDREQRPDIDGFFMEYISKTRGHGGWPLNVILKPDLTPVYALTYAPARGRRGRSSLVSILKKVREDPPSYSNRDQEYAEDEREVSLDYVMEIFTSYFDYSYGGFGSEEKFPPHSSLLFLLNYYEMRKDEGVLPLIEGTLKSIILGGLHDHLQGGFFRYCVDREWRIPHFEKMLYDQALLLWILSEAYRVLGREEYRLAADKVILSLEDTFREEGLFYTAHDADTDHREGRSYLWSWRELSEILTPEEAEAVCRIYEAPQEGNFEGQIHLRRKNYEAIPAIESKLLKARRKRKQPFVDKKILTSWNALTGIGLVMHWRATGERGSLCRAEGLLEDLLKLHYREGRLVHSSLDGRVQEGEFMGDYASLLLFVTYLNEEDGGYEELLEELSERLLSFREDEWIESRNRDFREMAARPYDLSIPSSISMAEMALLRYDILRGKTLRPLEFKSPLDCDFHNAAALLSRK